MNQKEFENQFVNQIICGDWITELKKLPAGIFHCVVTSPPYWGQRDYKCEGQMGLEKTPEEHIEKLVEGFREVRRVLRDDGVVFLNYGDKYNAGRNGGWAGGKNSGFQQVDARYKNESGPNVEGYKPGDLLMLPARVALALQNDGWILRDDITWAKAISFCDKYSGSTMPESVNGWRWERHRIKIGSKKGCKQTTNPASYDQQNGGTETPIWQDCPGCEICGPNDGLVLRKGSWRCTKASEHIFQLVKTNHYFCDMDAVREQTGNEMTWEEYESHLGNRFGDNLKTRYGIDKYDGGHSHPSGRNLRNVWAINPQQYKGSHYATFPEALVKPCIKVATSQKGVCPKCGAQWARIVDSKAVKRYRPNDKTDRHNQGEGVNSCGNTVAGVETTTLGWRATCRCGIKETVPALVLDPFIGTGTTPVVAAKLNRKYFGIEINPNYVKEHCDIRVKAAETGLDVKEVKIKQAALFE